MRTGFISLIQRPVCSQCRGIVFRLNQRRSLFKVRKIIASGENRGKPFTRLPQKPARTRFAPSPTGYLHLGSLRTALYNYLLARATNGQFLLRLEDTDQTRIVGDAEERLYRDLSWSGLSWDEGPDCGGPHGPYKQSERLDIYRRHAAQLLDQGKAFRCFCSKEDVTAHQRESLESNGSTGQYPGTCLAISKEDSDERVARGDAYTIRFKSRRQPVGFADLVTGPFRKQHPEDDFIIMKTDGFPTYHFANVVDDHAMGITHVIRGAEWLISTPKHVDLYKAFGWEPPTFAHVGLLVDQHRQKLSKRNMDIGIDSYRNQLKLPPALLNFAALLGWQPLQGSHKDVMSMEDLVKEFSKRFKFTAGDIAVDFSKLNHLQKNHTRRLLFEEPPNTALINHYLIEPLIPIINELETARVSGVTQLTAGLHDLLNDYEAYNAKSGHIQPTDVFLSNLGGIHPNLKNIISEEARQHILTAIKISRTLKPFPMIWDLRYLLWQPSIEQVSEAYSQFKDQIDIREIFVNDDRHTPSAAMEYLLRRFEDVDNQHWTAENMMEVLKDTVNRVGGEKPNDEDGGKLGGGKQNGFLFLRWAFFCMHTGPQMHELMALLGKEECLRRLRIAQTVAETDEIDHHTSGTD